MSDTRKKSCQNIVYFDNNSTTLINVQAKKIHSEWLECYNASSDSKIAKPAKQQLERATDAILAHCGVSTATHTALFTSGATESNCLIIKSCVKSYKRKLIEKGSELRPHIITSALEHHSIMECLHDLTECGDIDVSYIEPTIYGNILPEDVKSAIQPNTCLITIMFANNELPVINNLSEIGEIAHERRIPVHSDCVQVFGKYKINMDTHNLDALSASAHKFYGPKGVGLLIISNKLIEGYGLTAEIHGSQQYGLRGGTENIAGISSMMVALKSAFNNRHEKNKKLYKLRDYMLAKLANIFHFGTYLNYLTDKDTKNPVEMVSLGPPDKNKGFILPNTILLAIAKNTGKPFCNVDLKKSLDARNIIVSIGSACLTKSKSASHVLNAIGAPPVIKRGVIRISFGDLNTNEEVNKFCKIFKECVLKQCSDIKSADILVKPKPKEKKIDDVAENSANSKMNKVDIEPPKTDLGSKTTAKPVQKLGMNQLGMNQLQPNKLGTNQINTMVQQQPRTLLQTIQQPQPMQKNNNKNDNKNDKVALLTLLQNQK
jgi:cysteine desulfurase